MYLVATGAERAAGLPEKGSLRQALPDLHEQVLEFWFEMMHNLPTIDSLSGYQSLPRIDLLSVRILWHVSYWDGPQSGLLLYKGEPYWFQAVEENEGNDWFRRFLVVRLSEEQLREETYWHDLFRAKVGTQTDYDSEGRRQIGALRPEEMWHDFYDSYKNRQPWDLSNNAVVGWFEM